LINFSEGAGMSDKDYCEILLLFLLDPEEKVMVQYCDINVHPAKTVMCCVCYPKRLSRYDSSYTVVEKRRLPANVWVHKERGIGEYRKYVRS
jgi:hypothetical protein